MWSVFLLAVLLLALAWGAYAFWRRGVDRDVAEGAQAEHARLVDLDARAASARAEAATLTGLSEEGAVAALQALRKDVLAALRAAKMGPRLAKAPDREALLGFAAVADASTLATDETATRQAERLTGLRAEEAVPLVATLAETMRGASAALAAFAERAPADDGSDRALAFAMGRTLDLAAHAPLLAGMPPDAFRRIYGRVETPRFPAYALAAVTAFVLGTPLVLGVLGGLSFLFEPEDVGRAAVQLQMGDGGAANLASQVSTEELQYILQGWSGFYYFFGLLAFWIIILVVVMRRYHARTPDLLREEVLRSR